MHRHTHKRSKSCSFQEKTRLDDDKISAPKSATELIQEIAVLEFQVSHLEQYLLSLYRKAFYQQTSFESPSSRQQTPSSPISRKCLNFSRTYYTPGIESRCFSFDNRPREPGLAKDVGSGVRRCQSSLNQQSTFNNRITSPEEYIGKGSSISIMTPNKLSEEMIKCISTIYCKLADTQVLLSSTSSPSSTSEVSVSPHDLWSPSCRKHASFDDRSEFSGPYSSMIEVLSVRRKGHDVELMLRHFRLLVKQLQSVDPGPLTHQEKLAFWINLHNSLVMHTYLAYGIPQNNGKRCLLLSKTTYNIGGCVMSLETLQSSILLSRMPRHGQWLRLLLTPRKLRTGDEYREYALEHSEPLLYFALCSGSHSDPAIRVYMPKSIYMELETAKEEYIQATFGVRKDQKLTLPKIIESFSKDSGLSQAALMEMIQECVPEPTRETIKKLNMGRSRKSLVEWTPHNFGFRYLIARELIQ